MMLEELLEPELLSGDPPRILIIEDDKQIAEMLREHFEYALGAEVRWAADGTEAMELDADKWAEVIIVDYLLPDMDGIKLVEILDNDGLSRPCVFVTGYPSVDCAIEAMRVGMRDMFVKPFDMDKVANTIAKLVEQYRRENLRFKRLKKMRKLVKEFTRERRELRRKVDFLCKDVVQSYKELLIKIQDKGIKFS